MSSIVPFQKNKNQDVERAQEVLAAAVEQVEPLQVSEKGKWGLADKRIILTPTTVDSLKTLTDETQEYSNKQIRSGALAGLAAGAGVDALLIPVFFINDALLYSVGIPVPVLLASLGMTLGYRKGKILADNVKAFFVKSYQSKVERAVSDAYGKRFNDKDVQKITAIVSGLEQNSSSTEFTDVTDGREYKLVKTGNASWQLVHGGVLGLPIKTQKALDTASEVLGLMASSAVKKFQNLKPSEKDENEDSLILQTVKEKIRVLTNIQLAIEDEYRVEKAAKDVKETVQLAADLKQLKDANYLESFNQSLELVDKTLDTIILRYQDAIRSEFLAEREKFTPDGLKLKP